MKYLLKTLKIILICIVSIVIVLFIYEVFFYKPYYPGPESDEPLPDLRTKRERLFCDSLMALNYPEVKIDKRIYFDYSQEKVCYKYYLIYKLTPAFSENQADSINWENIRLITSLLRNYATDRVLYENEVFYIHYADVPSSTYRIIDKKTLTQICGFKVIKIGKDKYRRIYFRKKGSEPKLFIPRTWIRDNGKY
jgi:hypothetical protein